MIRYYFLKKIINKLPEVIKKELEYMDSFIEEIDWSNPIDAVYTLNQEIKTGSGLTKEYAQSMMEVESSFFSAGS